MIPVNEPLFEGNEKKYLAECIDSGWISSEGPFVRRFEEEFADYVGTSYGCAVANGTAALEVALYSLGVGPGVEVIMPSFTIMSCAVACLRLGGIPVLVDIEPETWCMDVAQIEAVITPKTKVIMPVHIYGHPVDMDPLLALREKYGLFILEDASEVHGAEYYSSRSGAWRKCGSIGDMATFSFYANKIISTGEGGMVLSNNEQLMERCRNYRNLCFGKSERFLHDDLGYNFRMSNLQAAVGLAQLEQIDRFIEIKRFWGCYYAEALKLCHGLRFMPVKPWAKSVYWMYAVELRPESGYVANALMEKLKEKGIATRPFFRGLHSMPILAGKIICRPQEYPATDFAYKYGFYLPSGLALTKEQADTVILNLLKILSGEK